MKPTTEEKKLAVELAQNVKWHIPMKYNAFLSKNVTWEGGILHKEKKKKRKNYDYSQSCFIITILEYMLGQEYIVSRLKNTVLLRGFGYMKFFFFSRAEGIYFSWWSEQDTQSPCQVLELWPPETDL